VSCVAAWAAGLGLMAPRRPIGCGIQLRQRAYEMVASVAGHGRKPVGEDVAPSATWPREADRFRCTVAISATAKNGSAQAIWAISASRFTWSLKRSVGTHNPLVAGSSRVGRLCYFPVSLGTPIAIGIGVGVNILWPSHFDTT
jgi:hypothetical protein